MPPNFQPLPTPGIDRPFAYQDAEIFYLSNGLRVVLVQDTQAVDVTWSLAFDKGTRTDPLEQEGLASLCTDVIVLSHWAART